MTNQEKKKYLGQYKGCLMEIEQLEEEIRRLGARAEGLSAMPGGTPGGSGENPMQACIDQMVEFQNLLVEKVRESVRVREEIERAIGAVEDGKLRLLLRCRYIEGMTFEEIAVKMFYSYMQVCRLHGQALEQCAV